MNIRPSETLIAELRRRQERAGLSEIKFAELLGLADSTWVLIRTRKAKPGFKFLVGVVRLYPDLEGDVMAFLRSEPGLMDMWSRDVQVPA